MESLRKKVVKGVGWILLDTMTTKVASFLVTLVLARLLTPDDYGTVALLTLIVNMSWALIDSGFGLALVQKKDADDLDFNSVFYLTVLFAGVIYLAVFIAAPSVASFYGRPELCLMLRVLAITLVLNAIGGIQGASLQRRMAFNLSFRIGLSRFCATASVGIGLAVAGFGAWALVSSTVAGGVVSVLSGWYWVGWRPKPMFSFSAVRKLFSFGWKYSASWLMSIMYDNIYGMVIGKVYTPTDFAFYTKGRQTPELALLAVNNTVQRISFPAIAKIQDDIVRVRNAMRRMIKCSTFVMFPAMVGMAVCSESLIPFLYGDQWGQAIPYSVIMCFSFALYPFHTVNLQTISAIGRSDIFLKLEIVKKIVSFILLLSTYRLGVLLMIALSTLVGGPLGVAINAYPNKKLLGYSVTMQVSDTLPALAASLLMGGLIWLVRFANMGVWTFFAQIVVGVLSYLLFSWWFKLDAFREYVTVLNDAIGARVPQFIRPAYARAIYRLGISTK